MLTITIDTTEAQDAAIAVAAAQHGETAEAFVARLARKVIVGKADEAVAEKVRRSVPAMTRAYLAADAEQRTKALDALSLVDKGDRIGPADEPEPTKDETTTEPTDTRG
jgi:hypothetical protein